MFEPVLESGSGSVSGPRLLRLLLLRELMLWSWFGPGFAVGEVGGEYRTPV